MVRKFTPEEADRVNGLVKWPTQQRRGTADYEKELTFWVDFKGGFK